MFFAFAIHGSGEIDVVACRTRASTGQSGLSWFLLNKGAGTMPSSDCRLSACSADALTRASATLAGRARHPWRGFSFHVLRSNQVEMLSGKEQ